MDGLKFLGGYFGPLTGLQYALLLNQESVALDIIDASFKEDLLMLWGRGNTCLHLAALSGSKDAVASLLERGADPLVRNAKDFSPIDVGDSDELTALFSKSVKQQNDQPNGCNITNSSNSNGEIIKCNDANQIPVLVSN